MATKRRDGSLQQRGLGSENHRALPFRDNECLLTLQGIRKIINQSAEAIVARFDMHTLSNVAARLEMNCRLVVLPMDESAERLGQEGFVLFGYDF